MIPVKASSFDLAVMLVSGIVGYVLRLAKFDIAPLLVAFVLGDRIEISFRRALTISEGDFMIFVKGPAAQGSLLILAAVMLGVLVLRLRKRPVVA